MKINIWTLPLLTLLLISCGQLNDKTYQLRIEKLSTRPFEVNFKLGDNSIYLDNSLLQSEYEGFFVSEGDSVDFKIVGTNTVEGAAVMSSYDAVGTASLNRRNSDGTSEIEIIVTHDAAYNSIWVALGYLLVEDAAGKTYVVRTLQKSSGIARINDPGGFFEPGVCRLIGVDPFSLSATRISHSGNVTVLTVNSSAGLHPGDHLYADELPVISSGTGPSYVVQLPDGSTPTVNNTDGLTGLSAGSSAHEGFRWFEISSINSPTEIEVIDPDGIWDYDGDGSGDGSYFDESPGGNATYLQYKLYKNGTLIQSNSICKETGSGADELAFFIH